MITSDLAAGALQQGNRVFADKWGKFFPRSTRLARRPAWSRCLCDAVIGLWLAAFAFTADAQGIPPHVQADLLKQKVLVAMKAGDRAAILSNIAELDRMGEEMVPPTLRIPEAKAAQQTGDPARAVTALQRYFRAVQRDDDRYSEALDMYSRLIEMPEVQAASDAQRAVAMKEKATTADSIRSQIDAEHEAFREREKECAPLANEAAEKRKQFYDCVKMPEYPCEAKEQAYYEAEGRNKSCTRLDEYLKRVKELRTSLNEVTASMTD